jgi:transcription antitermination factor NusA-like protein
MSGANDDTSQVRNAAGRLRALMGELKLPKEIANHILAQIDETKHAALAVIARETRLFLEKTNISEELAKLLTQVTFEIKTEVRFVPNDKGKVGLLPKVKISGPTFGQKEEDGNDEKHEKDGKDENDPET